MKTTKTLIAALTAATALGALAAPAAAQSYDRGYGHDRYDRADDRDRGDDRYDRYDRYDRQDRWDDRRGDNNINARQAEIARRIEWGVRRGALDYREAQSLRIEFRDIAQLEAQYRRGGLTGPEHRGIDRRLDRLESLLERDLNDREYGSGYGYEHRRY